MARHDSYPIAFPILDDAQITALGQFATFEPFHVAQARVCRGVSVHGKANRGGNSHGSDHQEVFHGHP
jgi:hypothetical protein